MHISKHHIIYFILLVLFFIEVYLIYNVVSISAVQESDLVIIYIHIFFIVLFSIMVYHRILNIVPFMDHSLVKAKGFV